MAAAVAGLFRTTPSRAIPISSPSCCFETLLDDSKREKEELDRTVKMIRELKLWR